MKAWWSVCGGALSPSQTTGVGAVQRGEGAWRREEHLIKRSLCFPSPSAPPRAVPRMPGQAGA